MQRALEMRDYSIEYIQEVGSRSDTGDLQRGSDVERARRLDPALGARPRRVHGGGRVAVPVASRRRARRLGARRDVRRDGVLRTRQLRPGQPVRRRCRGRPQLRRCRTQPPAAESRPRPVPSADPVSRVRRLHGAVRVRDRRPHHRTRRRGLADGDPSLGAVLVGLPHDRHPARRLVELRGARLVRCLGLGSGRERLAAPVAHRHGVHPLRARAAAEGHAPRLEPQPARGHLRLDDPGDVPDPIRGDQQRACVRGR